MGKYVFISIIVAIFLYVLIGVVYWALTTDKEFIESAAKKHELLPSILVMLWPIAFYKFGLHPPKII